MRRPLLVLLSLATACVHGAGGIAPGAGPPSPAASASGAASSSTAEAEARPGETPAQVTPEAGLAANPPATPNADHARERLVGTARRHLARRFAGDCSGFVRRVYAEARVALPAFGPGRTMSESLYQSLSPIARPQPGDLAFFHATRSRDRAGKARDRFTHVALVEAVDGARVTLIHRGLRGIRRLAMNLERPHDRSENGMVRRHRAGDRPGQRYLSAELFAGYATALGQELPSPVPRDLGPPPGPAEDGSPRELVGFAR